MDSPAINTDYLEWSRHEFPHSIKENILEVFSQFLILLMSHYKALSLSSPPPQCGDK
jgi:hypothetical protein